MARNEHPVADPTAVTTADQDAWVALWEHTRARLAEMIPLIPAMRPAEAKDFVETMEYAMAGHFRALTLDKRLDLEMARTSVD